MTPHDHAGLIARGRPHLKRAEVYHNDGAELLQHEGRSNSEGSFNLDASDVVLSFIHDGSVERLDLA